jgi:beta-glucosidase
MLFFKPECPAGLRALSFLLVSDLIATSSAAVLQPRDAVPSGYVAAPYYPAPLGGWDDDWTDAYAKAIKLVAQMTLAEKTNITSGSGMWMGYVFLYTTNLGKKKGKNY